VVPSEQIIDIGRKARLECLTEERDRSSIVWKKDGQALPNHARFVPRKWMPSRRLTLPCLSLPRRIVEGRQVLQIFNLQREDYGMYQCFVARNGREAQAASELRLGGEQTLLIRTRIGPLFFPTCRNVEPLMGSCVSCVCLMAYLFGLGGDAREDHRTKLTLT